MAKMKGSADGAAEATGGGGGNKFPAAPRGVYTIQIADYEDGTTKASGRPKTTLKPEIADEECLGTWVSWITMTNIPKGEKGHGFMIQIMKAFYDKDTKQTVYDRVVQPDGTYDYDSSIFQGARARALLGIETYDKDVNGTTYTNERNYVEELYTVTHPEPACDALPAPKARTRKDSVTANAMAAAHGTKVAAKTGNEDEVPF